MRSRRLTLAILALGLCVAAPALAHHSAAMFDRDHPVTLSGAVVEWRWTNPHVFLKLKAKDAKGEVQDWMIEGGDPASFIRQGINRASFKPGDAVSVTINPLRNGGLGGALAGATLADGKTFGRAAPAY